MPDPITYDHVQRGWLHAFLQVLAIPVIAFALFQDEDTAQLIAILTVGLVLEVIALSFAHLRISDQGDHLRAAFGPLPLFRKRVAYADMRKATRSRSSLLEGWGIHWIPAKGWIWNLQGRDCVRIQLANKRQLTLGTDDADGLQTFLEQKMAA